MCSNQRLVSKYAWQEAVAKIMVYVDSDWAGCLRTRRSTSGGAAFWRKHLVLHWSKTQPVIALSSGEAELNAVLKGSAEAMMIKETSKEMHSDIEAEVRSDSGACIGTVNRKGSGKIKHLEVKQLRLQERIGETRIKITKIPRDLNPADLCIHHCTVKEAWSHLKLMNTEIRGFQGSVA